MNDELIANKIANNLFVSTLMKKHDALEYLVSRGLTEETILNFQLGYACAVITILKSHGLPYSHLATLDGEYEYFVNRITIPFISGQNIIGFTSRAFPEHEKKHLHQRGLDISFYNENDLNNDYIIIVESPICCLTLKQLGLSVVALCGSSKSHVEKIKPDTKVYLLPDIDVHRTGEREFVKLAVKLRHKIGNNFIKIAYLSDNYDQKTDANSFMLTHKKDELIQILKQAVSIENHKQIDNLSFSNELNKLQNRQISKEVVFNNKIKRIKSKINIKDIISEYAEIKQHGNILSCCCPLHKDNTPSLTIYEDTQSWYCFGCNNGGDVIEFIKKVENVEFGHAVGILNKKIEGD